VEVKLSIESGNLGETVVDMFQKLTPETMEKVATDVLREWLREPYDVEAQLLDQQAIYEVRKNNIGYGKLLDDKECRDHYQFRQARANQKSTRQVMVEQITKAVIEHHKKVVTKEIQNDPQIQAVLKATLDTVRENFPKFVHDAMIAWFSSHLTQLGNGISTALMQSTQTEVLTKEIADHVGVNY
jgi:hypothetical protein